MGLESLSRSLRESRNPCSSTNAEFMSWSFATDTAAVLRTYGSYKVSTKFMIKKAPCFIIKAPSPYEPNQFSAYIWDLSCLVYFAFAYLIFQAFSQRFTEIFCNLIHSNTAHSPNSQCPYQRIGIFAIFNKGVYCHNGHIGLAFSIVHQVKIDQLFKLQIISLKNNKSIIKHKRTVGKYFLYIFTPFPRNTLISHLDAE